jgi:hypothetical protein
MKQTALQQLITWGDERLKSEPMKTLSFAEAIDMAEELLELEKEQQKFMFDCGRQYQLTGEGTFTQVYNETYNK